MKQNFLKFFLTTGVILSLGALAVSCSSDDTKDDGPTPPPDPGKNNYVVSEGPTPIRYVESKYIGSDNGVSVETTIESNNLKFTCKPGKDISSYRLQVYPLGSMYNTMINQMNSVNKESLTTTETENILLLALNNPDATATGGKLINEQGYGEAFSSFELDYMNSELQVFMIQPDTEYLIVVQAFFDEEGNTSGDLCILHVRTPKRDLVGSPEVGIDVAPDFTRYDVTYVPNGDCRYIYFLSSVTSDIQQYIDAYGEDMYRQLLCHYGDRLDVKTDDLTSSAPDQDPKLNYVATAVALDVNGTAVNKVFRRDFQLEQIPDETEAAQCLIDNPDKIGGSVIEFGVHQERNCKKLRFQVLPKARAEAILSGTEAERQRYADQIFSNISEANSSWVVENYKFAFDRNTNTPSGDRQDVREYWWELTGDTEYIILYAAVNYYDEVSQLQATDAFRTKPHVRNNPAGCQADLEMNIIATDRTSVTLQFKYNSEKTALYYFQYYSPDPLGPPTRIFPDVKDGSDDARYGTGKYADASYINSQNGTGWLHYLLDYRNNDPNRTPWPNMWYADGKGDQEQTYQWTGFSANNTYEFVYMAEDWNGVLSPVKFCTAVTPVVEGGPNPTVEMTAQNLGDGTYQVMYNCNEDMREIRYMTASINSQEATALALAALRDKDPSLTYQDYVEAWEEYVLANGLFDSSLSISQTLIPDGAISVAMAMAIGTNNDEAKTPAYSKLATLVFKDGKVTTLAEYLGVKAASTGNAANHTAAAARLTSFPGPAVQPNGRQRLIWRQ